MKTHLYVTAELATEIKEARKRKRFRQEDLALEGFLSTGTISRMERGSVSVSREKAAYLCQQLDINIQKYQRAEDENTEMDISLKLLSIENHLNMISPDEAWKELRKIKPDSEYHRIWHLYLKARYWERKGKAEKASAFYLQVAQNDDPELRNHNFTAAGYHALGRICFYDDEMEKALEYVQQGLEIFYSEGDRKHIYHFLLISKAIYLEALNRDEEALLVVEELWINQKQIDSREVILSLYEMKTRLLTKLARYDDAIVLANEGLTTARINRMYDHACYLWIALGECYNKQKKTQNAEICFQSAINMNTKMRNKQFITKLFLKIGKLYQQAQLHKKANEMFTTALQKAKKNLQKDLMAESLECIGDYYMQIEKMDKAKKAYEESLANYKKINKQKNIKNLLLKVASCYRDSNRTKYYDLLDEYYQIYHDGRETYESTRST